MYPFRLSLAAPYWSGDTYRAILRSIFSGAILDGPDLHALKASLLERLGVADAVLCGSGSLALELALRACGVCAGNEVVLPSFCCTAVVPPIVALGATPVLADIGTELNLTAETVQDALTQKTKAVIVPHLFGNPAEIDRIIELVAARNIRVIDDAAQALGAMLDGKPVGSFGDAGVLSYGAEKVCSGIGGGVVVARDEQIAKLSETEISQAPFWPTLKHLLSQTLCRRIRRWTELFPTDSATPDQLPIPYRREQMSQVAAAVAASLMQIIEENIAARRVRVQAYRTLLDCSGIELIAHREGSACLTQVIRVVARRNEDDPAARLVAVLRRAGCDVRGSYVPIHLLRSFGQCVWDRLPNTDRVWADLVELPCHPNVRLAELERIADLIRRGNGP